MSLIDLLNERIPSSGHYLKSKKRYTVSIYCGGGKISEWNNLTKEQKKTQLAKRWYIRWTYRNPNTGLLERQTNIRGGANRFITKKERYNILKVYKKALEQLLKSGFSPYNEPDTEVPLTVEQAFNFALRIKKKEVQDTTYKDYENRSLHLKQFLDDKGVFFAIDIKKKHISSFLNKYNSKNSNNFKSAISSIFTVLSDQDVIPINFVKEIRNKSERKKAIRIYTQEEVDSINVLLEKYDKQLAMYVKLISYMFWRPIEIVKITSSNIDLENSIIRVDTKGKDGKTKIIPEVILGDFKEFAEGKDGYLFSPHKDGSWSVDDVDKRKYYTKRFARFRNEYDISSDFKMYNFRHTFISKAYLKLRKTLSVKDTITQLSLITGHTSNAIWKYIQVNDVELPEDYSDLFD